MEGSSCGPPGPGDPQNASGSGSQGQVKKKDYTAYKLIVDPFLVKGAFKTYRFDGHLPEDPNYPTVVVRDPRSHMLVSIRRNKSDRMELPVPFFKVDSNYVGKPPPIEVTITNVNDNIGKNFLKETITKNVQEGLEDVIVYYHPISNKHLGLAHAVFKRPVFARLCVEKLNNLSLMGQKLSVFLDALGAKCKDLVDELTIERKVAKSDDKSESDIIGAKVVVNRDEMGNISEADKTTPKKVIPTTDIGSAEKITGKDPINGAYKDRSLQCYNNIHPVGKLLKIR